MDTDRIWIRIQIKSKKEKERKNKQTKYKKKLNLVPAGNTGTAAPTALHGDQFSTGVTS
jgi:hypothetical protein